MGRCPFCRTELLPEGCQRRPGQGQGKAQQDWVRRGASRGSLSSQAVCLTPLGSQLSL